MATARAPVLIAGGGPVGMTLALSLAQHGVRSILVERNPSTTRHPKMDLTNGRSMELYRRLGIVDAIRAVGVPEDHVFDIMWATSPSGHLLHNFKYPSAASVRVATQQTNDGTGTAEPPIRISQIALEPVLKRQIESNDFIESHFGLMLQDFRQDANGVVVTTRQTDGNLTKEFAASYLVGCDGGGSRVRRILEIGLEGQQSIARILMIHFISRDKAVLNPWGTAYHLQTGLGSMVAQDDFETWTVQIPLPPGIDESAIDAAAMLRTFVGRDFDFKINVFNAWSPHLVIAERYIDGRVMLAGDSAHQVIPTGGYGLNTGVGDAMDLGWKLAAVVNGWGGEALLRSYETERKPIALQNRAASETHFGVRIQIAAAFAESEATGLLDEEGPVGDARRASLGAAIAALGNAENESWGIEYGYRYGDSAVIIAEDAAPPFFDPLRCVPNTYPGSRLPHVVLPENGGALIDRLGPEFTLIVIGTAEPGDFDKVAAALGIPLTIVRLNAPSTLALLEKKLLLVRPDQHIAWRGDAPPHDLEATFRKVVGQPLCKVG